MAELSGERLIEVVGRDAVDLLAVADRIVVSEAVSRDRVKASARRLVEQVGDSPLIELLAIEIADAIYVLAAADEHELGEVIGREHVDALVTKVLRMRNLRDRALERLLESPVVATVASWFVNRLVTDFMEANVERAERVPGVRRLVGAGRRAADAVRGQADRHLGDVLGDAAGRGAHLALRQLSRAIRETIEEAPLHDAALEFWDLHASEPIGRLREYLTEEELRELVLSIHEIWLTLRDTEYFAAAVDAGIDVFFDNYGSLTVGELLDELGVDRDQLVADAELLVPPLIGSVSSAGLLRPLVRSRLEQFLRSEHALALLRAGTRSAG
jgi:hypothetical protein